MFSTDFIFRQQENLVDNQKCQAGFRLLCNKILTLKPSLNAVAQTFCFIRYAYIVEERGTLFLRSSKARNH